MDSASVVDFILNYWYIFICIWIFRLTMMYCCWKHVCSKICIYCKRPNEANKYQKLICKEEADHATEISDQYLDHKSIIDRAIEV